MKPFRPFQPSEGSTSPFDIATYHDERDAVRSRSPHGVTAQPTKGICFNIFMQQRGFFSKCVGFRWSQYRLSTIVRTWKPHGKVEPPMNDIKKPDPANACSRFKLCTDPFGNVTRPVQHLLTGHLYIAPYIPVQHVRKYATRMCLDDSNLKQFIHFF